MNIITKELLFVGTAMFGPSIFILLCIKLGKFIDWIACNL